MSVSPPLPPKKSLPTPCLSSVAFSSYVRGRSFGHFGAATVFGCCIAPLPMGTLMSQRAPQGNLAYEVQRPQASQHHHHRRHTILLGVACARHDMVAHWPRARQLPQPVAVTGPWPGSRKGRRPRASGCRARSDSGEPPSQPIISRIDYPNERRQGYPGSGGWPVINAAFDSFHLPGSMHNIALPAGPGLA